MMNRTNSKQPSQALKAGLKQQVFKVVKLESELKTCTEIGKAFYSLAAHTDNAPSPSLALGSSLI